MNWESNMDIPGLQTLDRCKHSWHVIRIGSDRDTPTFAGFTFFPK